MVNKAHYFYVRSDYVLYDDSGILIPYNGTMSSISSREVAMYKKFRFTTPQTGPESRQEGHYDNEVNLNMSGQSLPSQYFYKGIGNMNEEVSLKIVVKEQKQLYLDFLFDAYKRIYIRKP